MKNNQEGGNKGGENSIWNVYARETVEPHFPVRNGDHGYGPYGNPAAQFRKGNVEVAIFVDNMREKMIIVEGMGFFVAR